MITRRFSDFWRAYVKDELDRYTDKNLLDTLEVHCENAWYAGATEYGMCMHCLDGDATTKDGKCFFCNGTGMSSK